MVVGCGKVWEPHLALLFLPLSALPCFCLWVSLTWHWSETRNECLQASKCFPHPRLGLKHCVSVRDTLGTGLIFNTSLHLYQTLTRLDLTKTAGRAHFSHHFGQTVKAGWSYLQVRKGLLIVFFKRSHLVIDWCWRKKNTLINSEIMAIKVNLPQW